MADPPIDPVQRIDVLIELAWALRNSEAERAHALAQEARELAMAQGYKLGQARAARTMAMTVRRPAQMPAVLPLAEEAKRLFDEVGDAYGRAASRDFLASIYEHLGELTVALDYALDALAIARKLDDPIRQGYALSNVGGILAASGDIEVAIERLQEALQLFEAAGDLGGIGTITSRLARVFRTAGRKEEALAHAERCLTIGREAQNEWAYASAFMVMAQLEEERGDMIEAERLYRASLDSLATEPGRNLLGAGVQVALGRLLMARGALAEATHELTDALARIEHDSVSIVAVCEAHQALADLHEKQGELAPAIAHLRRAQALRDQIAQREARTKLAQVEARAAREAAEKDAEIHKLRFVELHAIQAKLVVAEKMAVLGTLAAGAAHELNTPLGVLGSNSQLSETATARLLALLDEGDPRAAKLAAVLESCRRSTEDALERIASVAERFKRFTQLDQAERRTFDVEEGLESAIALLEPSIPSGIDIERRFAKVPPIEGWPRELNQAFLTVLENAVQAIEGSGVVSAETSATDDRVFVRVSDTGRGMSEEKAQHLFDMGWSEEGTRTKLRMGLCAAHAITERHGGEIAVQSTIGRGTTVTFSFSIARR